MNKFSSLETYSQAVYALLEESSSLLSHTIRVYPRGATIGVVEGDVLFAQEIVFRVYERVDFALERIVAYS